MSEETKKVVEKQPEKETKVVIDSKAVLKKAAKEERKVKYGERMELEILVATKHYRKGQVIQPHVVLGEELVKNKIAKKVKKED